MLDQGREVIARAMIEVIPVSATIEARGGSLPARRSRSHRRSRTVAGTPSSWWVPARRRMRRRWWGADVGRGGEVRFDAPAEPGLYALRYRLGSTGEVIAESQFEVVALDAGIVAPAEAAAGSTITVTWTGPGGAQDRIALARPDQSSFQWVEAHKTSDGAELTFTLPAEAGTYELRYVDVTNRVVLATVAVQAN
ncbi:MAG: hypothetical protein M5U09_13455 [Gammaproteobacteria bacterium]|nr:hypothetical protein [Gammaproteobacteria bacterium]